MLRKNGEGDNTHLERDNEKHAIRQNGPDEDVSKDSRHQIMRVIYHQRTIPVDSDKRPGQRSRSDGRMDEAWGRVVAEIQDREVEEVGDEDDFGPDKVRAHKEHDKGKVEEIVEDEVAADAGGIVDSLLLTGEEVRDVSELEDKEADPEI